MLRAAGALARTSAACRRALSAAAFTPEQPLRVCVVGSGPAGFYTADRVRLQAAWPELQSDAARRAVWRAIHAMHAFSCRGAAYAPRVSVLLRCE
jgi:hypothetical protein